MSIQQTKDHRCLKDPTLIVNYMNVSHFKTVHVSIPVYALYGLIFLLFLSFSSYGQTGINTLTPKGALDVSSINNTGLVLPRVTAIEDVTDGTANPPLNGTTVFDISRDTTCFYLNNTWVCIGTDANGNPVLIDETSPTITYIKASNTNEGDIFGVSLALSEDGNTLAVGVPYERSNATGVNGNQFDNSASFAGAVYVFVRIAGTWSQQAYIKASNTETVDGFGYDVTLSNDGDTLAVSAIGEDSNATGINGDQTNNASSNSGAVYVFYRSGIVWTQQAYIKASNTDDQDIFGISIVLSGDGNTLAVGATNEASSAIGINGNETDNSSPGSGAVYVFTRIVNTWSQQAYIKSSNAETDDFFGRFMALSFNGNTLAIGAGGEDSNATGINGNQSNNVATSSGAVYLFERVAATWFQQAYIKASNTDAFDSFGGVQNSFFIAFGRLGDSITMSDDGNTLAIGAAAEDSLATGVNGSQTNNLVNTDSGAVYVFVRVGNIWSQEAYIKASNTEANDYFGSVIGLSGDGNTLAVATSSEQSNATGINGDQTDNSIIYSGAVYVFKRDGIVWTQMAYVKATNTGIDPWTSWGDAFGYTLAINGDGSTLVVGAPLEDSDATGINGNQNDNSAQDAGAVFVYGFN